MAADTLDRLSEKITKLLGMLNELDQFAGGSTMGAGRRGGGAGSGGVMSGSLAKFSTPPSKWGMAADITSAATSALAGVAGGVSMMMPDVGQTIAREGGLYTAGVMSGGLVSRNTLQKAVFSNLTTMSTPGAGANLTALLASRGMDLSSAGFINTLRATSNATRYLGIPTEAAGAAIERMTSGSTSANLLRQGIFTSDPYTGNIKSTTQIFEELYARSTYGRPKMSAGDTAEDIRRGFMGENIKGYGFDAATEEMYKAFAVAKAQGRTINFEDESSVQAAMAANQANGYVNPYLESYRLARTEDRNMETATQPYLQGIKDATDALVELKNFTNDNLIPTFGRLNAAIQTFAGDNTGGGVLAAGGSLLGGIGQGIGAVGTYLLGKKAFNAMTATSKAAKGASATAKGAKVTPKGGFVGMNGTSVLKGASKFIKGSAVLSVAGGAIGAMTGDDNPWDDWESFAGGAVVGGIAGSAAGGVGAIPGALIGGTIGYLGNAAGYYGAKLFGLGGSESSVGTGGTTDTARSFGQPTAGPVSASYGQKGAIWSAGYHKGTDYAVPTGTPVYAAAAGTVSKTQQGSGSHSYGLYVAIEHGGGYTTIYAHLSQALVSPGESVQKGQLIAKSGQSGHVTGPHLHFEVLKNGVSVDPGSLEAFVGSDKSAEKGKGEQKNGSSSNRVLDTVLGVGRGSGIPISMSWTGVKGVEMSTTQLVGAGLSGGALSLSSPVVSATGMAASTGVGGSSSSVGLGGTTDTTGGLQALQQGITETSHILATGGSRPNVTINLTISKASDDEARKFAHMVKNILEDETALDRIGSK